MKHASTQDSGIEPDSTFELRNSARMNGKCVRPRAADRPHGAAGHHGEPAAAPVGLPQLPGLPGLLQLAQRGGGAGAGGGGAGAGGAQVAR